MVERGKEEKKGGRGRRKKAGKEEAGEQKSKENE